MSMFGGHSVARKIQAVIAEVGAILRSMVSLYFFTGPILMLALYFQAVGQRVRASVLTLFRPFVSSPVLIVSFGALGGSAAIWLRHADPVGACRRTGWLSP